jgi:CheY-like chemotaxis protein
MISSKIKLPDQRINLYLDKDKSDPQYRSVIDDDRLTTATNDLSFLLIDTDPTTAEIFKKTLHKNHYKSIITNEGEALDLALKLQPNAIFISMNLTPKSGWSILEDLKKRDELRHIPVMLMSSYEINMKEVIANGAIGCQTHPINSTIILQMIDHCQRVNQVETKYVLLADNNATHIRALENFISSASIDCVLASNSQQAKEILQTKKVNCIVLDAGLSDQAIFEILDTVKSDQLLKNLPVIIYSGMSLSLHAEKRIQNYSDILAITISETFKGLSDMVSFYLHQPVGKIEERRHTTPYLEERALVGKHILIVDDDVRNIFSLTKILESHKMKVTSAIDGNEALAVLSNDKSIDLVLMDMMMPNKDGFETIHEIRLNEQMKNKKIISVTAKAMLGDREKCIQAGANDYITKPVDADRLISLLKVWLYR